jgi:hypothetical protein
VQNFDDALKATEGRNKNLLLGNGFSQSWSHDTFNYKNLLDKANFDIRNNGIKGVFEKLETYDFETVMGAMKSGIYVAQSFNEYPAFVKGVERDIELVKNILVSTITKTHPDLPHRIRDGQYVSARKFLSKFPKIFTLNYDLLLYWARNKVNLEPNNFHSDDGFRQGLTWVGGGTKQNVFFLHGALHLYDDLGTIKKHACTDYGDSIIEQVSENLRLNKFPIFVSEPNSKKKLDRIMHNPYLNYCYEKLGDIEDCLFIYGHSMDETDSHIFEQVHNSKVKSVYVSVYGNENSPSNRRLKANADAYFHACDVNYFQAETANVWG